jgi:glutamate-1-semialdehyde 2,1-aminomutase
VRDYQSALAADTTAYGTFFRGMLERGVYPPPSQFEAWFLSAAHTDAQIKKTIVAARGAMKDVARSRSRTRTRAVSVRSD